MKYSKIELILLVLSVILIGYLLFQRNNDKGYLVSLEDKLSTQKSISDSLRKTIDSLNEEIDEQKISLDNKLKETISNYEAKISKLTYKYNKERERVKTLTIDQQVALLTQNVGQIDSLPKLQVIDRDTTVAISPVHARIINSVYIDNEELHNVVTVLNQTQDSLFMVIDGYKFLVTTQEEEIEAYKELDRQSRDIITNKDEQLKEERKEANKRETKTAVIVGAAGVILGVILKAL